MSLLAYGIERVLPLRHVGYHPTSGKRRRMTITIPEQDGVTRRKLRSYLIRGFDEDASGDHGDSSRSCLDLRVSLVEGGLESGREPEPGYKQDRQNEYHLGNQNAILLDCRDSAGPRRRPQAKPARHLRFRRSGLGMPCRVAIPSQRSPAAEPRRPVHRRTNEDHHHEGVVLIGRPHQFGNELASMRSSSSGTAASEMGESGGRKHKAPTSQRTVSS